MIIIKKTRNYDLIGFPSRPLIQFYLRWSSGEADLRILRNQVNEAGKWRAAAR